MATVPIAIALARSQQTFENPGGFYTGTRPFGEVVFNTQGSAIAAKDAANTNVITMTGTLPAGFVYRLVELRCILSGVGGGDFNETEPTIGGLFTENQVTLKEFMLFATTLGAGITMPGFAVRNPSITNDHSNVYVPGSGDRLYSDVIDASQGISIMQLILVNDSGNATGAMVIGIYARFLQYTIAQLRNGSMWNSIPTLD